MTREEFIEFYTAKMGCSVDDLKSKFHMIAVPCQCGRDYCFGWQMISSLHVIGIDSYPEEIRQEIAEMRMGK